MATCSATLQRIFTAATLVLLVVKPPLALGKPPEAIFLPSPFQPKAPALTVPGDGLCVAYRVMSDIAKNYFRFDDRKPQVSPRELANQVNVLMDGGFNGPPRNDFTLRTALDLSNRYVAVSGEHTAIGDFNRTCDEGCPFSSPVPPAMEYFGNRFRGFLNVPQSWIGHDIYVAFRSDDGAYFEILPQDGKGEGQLVMTTGPEVGVEGLRITNKLRFPAPGLYPIEVGHAQLFNSAVLEWAFYTSADPPPPAFALPFESPSASADSPTLAMWPGLQLAEPGWFFQSRTGKHPLATAELCQQCPRSSVGLSGSEAGCSPGFFCNEAALCDLCQSNDQCGPSCMKCSGATPVCDGSRCVECTKDAECGNGNVCRDERCVPCTTKEACAGNSCSCCPGTLQCLKTPGNQYICGECQRDEECPDQRCDPYTLRCTATASSCVQDSNPRERCGAACERCSDERPHCLLGSLCVACRSDLDCAQGSYCESGDCLPCTTDRRCGSSCRACPHEQPFCRAELGRADSARCVQCLDDSHCGPGGRCLQDSLTCAAPCTIACEPGTVCKGDRCVQCVSASQCPCGQTCLVESGECREVCLDNQDCLGSECCSKSAGVCSKGRCKSDLTAHGGALCCAAAPAAPAAPAAASGSGGLWFAGLAALTMLVLLLRRRRAG
ncbi:MAG TPA: outer membrane exchange protein TraA family protein [Pseudomonadota bacterium]|nr:outer membrane exchange protein TraA family protein [Pseudomonadota bacterium]